jgi:hypothetical protein
MNADAELDAFLGRNSGFALDHRALDLNRASHGVNDAAELDEAAIPGSFDDAPVVHRDYRIDEVTPKRPEARKRAILIRARESAVTDHVGG